MSDTDGLDFLQADFDPASLTVPRLRSILVNYDVNYPSTAKKAQLVNIFIDKILPQKEKILKERDQARRSSRGIVNASLRESLEAEDFVPPSRTSRRSTRSKSKSSRLNFDEQEEEEAIYRKSKTSSPIKKTPRSSSKHARASDTDTGLDLEVRRKLLRTRKSDTPSHCQPETAKVNHDILDEYPRVKKEERRQSAFTYDNPFQSGSSPPTGKSPETRRKSQGISKERRKTSSHTRRRKTEPLQIDDEIYLPSSIKFEAPVTPNTLKAPSSFKDLSEYSIEPGEEFTPEEQSELIRERAATGVKSVSAFRKKHKSASGLSMRGPFWVMIFTILIGYSVWYRQEKIAVGYCGVGREAMPLISTAKEIPNWARIFIEPECEPCPHHAYCYDKMEAQCESDFLFKPHPLSLAGLLPLAPTCEPDGIKVRKIKAVADRAIEELRERRAKFECGALNDKARTINPTPEIDSNDLKKEVSKNRRKGMSEAEFDDLWVGGLSDAISRDEVQSRTDGTHTKLSSTSLTSLPLTCALRRSLRNTLAEYRFEIGGFLIIVISLLKLRSVIISRRKTNAAIPGLVSLTLERLTNQALLHQQNSNTERWISIGQLRDDILRDEHSIERRESVWRKVRIVIETNANVRSSQKEDRNGEVSRVWEWIGAVESRSVY